MVWLSVGALNRQFTFNWNDMSFVGRRRTLGGDKFKGFHCVLMFSTVSKILWLFPSQWSACDNYYSVVARRFNKTKIAETRKTLTAAESCPILIGFKLWNYNAKLSIWAPSRPDRCVIATISNWKIYIYKKKYRSRLILYTSFFASQITFQHSFAVWIMFHTEFK